MEGGEREYRTIALVLRRLSWREEGCVSIHCACHKEAGSMEGEGVHKDVKKRHDPRRWSHPNAYRRDFTPNPTSSFTAANKKLATPTPMEAKKYACTAYCPPQQETLVL